jgi:hypothetical protein
VLRILATDIDTGEEAVVETIKIDVSCLLFPKKGAEVSFCSNSLNL